MPSVSSHGLSVVPISTSLHKWLCNQAPPPFYRPNLVPHIKESAFSLQFASCITTEIFARTSSVLSEFFRSASTRRGLENADNEGLQSSLEVFEEQELRILRRVLLTVSFCTLPTLSPPSLAVMEKKNMGKKSPFNEQRILEQNRRMQTLNNAPSDFPGFVREGYNVTLIMTDEYKKTESGLIYLDIAEGQGDYPKSGQQVTFHYIGYNESGRRVDSSYQQGQPAKTRIGIKAMIPGFEEGLLTMKPGGKRRLIIPPELGPPVGPSTFFSAKQFEVFDVELLDAKDCTRRTIGFYSDFVCN